ncbi:MAG: 30S ribosome-binding factor RbfA [Peptostreptococcaceae bacterium]|nr:30S ribosome-binding factor RbfA [Peptostreptococcaceae bacterium]MDY5739798.1 30S ribosome-binding factor RbfA [Anaerovoracaceae bacterium]
MGKGYRQGRLSEEIRKIISEMLLREVKDPRLSSLITISEVKATQDGSYAVCYVTILSAAKDGDAKAKEEAEVLAGLNSAKGMFKKEIGHQIRMRNVPDLIFKIDRSMEYGRHISEVLRTIKKSEENRNE